MYAGRPLYSLSVVFMHRILVLCLMAILPSTVFSASPFERLMMNSPMQSAGAEQEEVIHMFTRNTRLVKADIPSVAPDFDSTVESMQAISFLHFPDWEKLPGPWYYNYLFRYKLF